MQGNGRNGAILPAGATPSSVPGLISALDVLFQPQPGFAHTFPLFGHLLCVIQTERRNNKASGGMGTGMSCPRGGRSKPVRMWPPTSYLAKTKGGWGVLSGPATGVGRGEGGLRPERAMGQEVGEPGI